MPFDLAWRRFLPDLAGTDDVLAYFPRTSNGAGRVPVIYCHGFAGSALAGPYSDSDEAADDLRSIASMGYPAFVPDLAGPSTWGNTASITALAATVTNLGTACGTRTDKVALAAESMGALVALNWAWRNPTKVAAVMLRVPVVNLEGFRARNVGVFGGAIHSAYGGSSSYTAALPDHDPAHANQLATLRSLADRIKVWHTTSDEYVAVAEVVAWCTAVGCERVAYEGDHAAGFDTPTSDVTPWVADAIARYA